MAGDALNLQRIRLYYGYTNEYDIERFYRDARIVEIYEASKETAKITICIARDQTRSYTRFWGNPEAPSLDRNREGNGDASDRRSDGRSESFGIGHLESIS